MANNTHGMIKIPEYKSWAGMKTRCFNPNTKSYSDYGGRGITVCDRWKNSFEDFFADMGSRPSSKHSLDRIDNDGDYQKDNCRWATPKEQSNNRRYNKLITINGKTLNITQWEKEKGFTKNVIWFRLKAGWSDYDAVMTLLNGKIRLITVGSNSLTIPEWTEKMGFNKTFIQKRLDRGWSELRAVTTPVGQYKTAKKKS